jgi:hypothetical protein
VGVPAAAVPLVPLALSLLLLLPHSLALLLASLLRFPLALFPLLFVPLSLALLLALLLTLVILPLPPRAAAGWLVLRLRQKYRLASGRPSGSHGYC